MGASCAFKLLESPISPQSFKWRKKMKIYVASSWRCLMQPAVVHLLRAAKFEVYDFRNPREGDKGFGWSQIDPKWKTWAAEQYCNGLDHDLAQSGFKSDFDAMKWADCCVLVLPCGRSAHLEGGYFVGANKPLHIYIPEQDFEPELMYKMANSISTSAGELLANLGVPN